ncbi:c-type cytochrome biogenesis protein CcsB [Nocardioides sp. Bht2]|uniref:c-type cytochrome biogenesis protein CcsB n=1 Tax=Nocardioides sp. Bht2 TaxID=3392297 RepID=UPI0039B6C837
MTNEAWETLSDQAATVCGVVYFLALLSYSAQWAGLRKLPADETPTSGTTALWGRFGLLLTAIGCAVHLVAMVGRGMAADPNRVPWGNMYEFVLSSTFVVVLAFLVFYRKYKLEWLSLWVLGLVWVTLMATMILLHDRVAPLAESLSSPWLVIHVSAAVLATGIFTLGGLVSILFLVKERQEKRVAVREAELVAAGGGGAVVTDAPAVEPGRLSRALSRLPFFRAPQGNTGILARVPSSKALDRLAYRLHAFAFPVWTFAVLIAGPIWAQVAWSRYWGWDAKEVWAFITWVVYAAYLHARVTAGWKGRNAAIVALIGFVTLLFNFIGINYFFGGGSKHSYAEPAVAVVQVVGTDMAQATQF